MSLIAKPSLIRRASSLVKHLESEGLTNTVKFLKWKLRLSIASNSSTWKLFYVQNPLVETGDVTDYTRHAEQVWRQLKSLPDVTLKEFAVDPARYRDYVKQANYEEFDPYYRGGNSGRESHRAEKLLQHFLSLELLNISPQDIYVDIASNTSPMYQIVNRIYGVSTYSLDLDFPTGINGSFIGANAGDIPVPDNFFSKMTLHCSFEHFANGSDIAFIRECNRVLRPGGRVCIVPLYILPDYCIRIDPTLESDISVSDTEGARKAYVRDYRAQYGRFYDVAHFQSRILENLGSLTATVYRIRDLDLLNEPELYSELALVIEKPV